MYSAKNENVERRALRVQELAIPLQIVGNATPASVVPSNDAQAILSIQTEGVNQITANLATNETATFLVAASDATGIFNMLVRIDESIEKVVAAYAVRRDALEVIPVRLGSASGITTGSAGGKSIMLTADSALALNAANTLDCCVIVKYITRS